MSRQSSITVIGPRPPYTGGISQYNECLLQSFGTSCDVKSVDFTRLYPKTIYPGVGPHRKETLNDGIDNLNPKQWNSICQKIIASFPDIVILHWWTYAIFPFYCYLAKRLKEHQIPLGIIAHNPNPHQEFGFSKVLRSLIFKNASRIWCHSVYDQTKLQEAYPNAKVYYHPHPTYSQFESSQTESQSGGTTSVNKPRERTQLLFFGFVRAYKGVEILYDLMQSLPEDQFNLRIVGQWWGQPSLKRKLASLNNVEVINRYVADSQVAAYFLQADALLLPYQSATGSGVATIAGHFGLPIFGSDLPQFNELHFERKLDPHHFLPWKNALIEFHRNKGRSKHSPQIPWQSLAESLIEGSRMGRV